MARILITGAAGFIGSQLIGSIIRGNDEIVGIDNLQQNQDYTIKLKRLATFGIEGERAESGRPASGNSLTFIKTDLQDKEKLEDIFSQYDFDPVIHLAAQTGVRHSVFYPQMYTDNNITTFNNLLECCRKHGVIKLIYASSSSVYGMNKKMPYSESDPTDTPVSIYAVTKKTNELLASTYSVQNKMYCVGLRFFTVYGPWCRTDMAAYIFMKAITEGKELNLYNDGNMLRDFTYVNDVTKSIILIKDKMLHENQALPYHEVFNVGNRNPATLSDYLSIIEHEIGKEAIIKYKPIQLGDVVNTYADVRKLESLIGFKPATDLKYGVKEMVDWFKEYYHNLTEK